MVILSKTGESQILTSKKMKDDKKKLKKMKDEASKLVPYRPNQRPPKPHNSVLMNGNKIILKYISNYFLRHIIFVEKIIFLKIVESQKKNALVTAFDNFALIGVTLDSVFNFKIKLIFSKLELIFSILFFKCKLEFPVKTIILLIFSIFSSRRN